MTIKEYLKKPVTCHSRVDKSKKQAFFEFCLPHVTCFYFYLFN